MRTLIFAVLLLLPSASLAQNAEKQLIATITSAQAKGGVLSEITWDGGMLVLQGVFANPDGSLNPQYWITPVDNVSLEPRTAHTEASAKYWEMKSRTTSPAGIGKITISTDSSLPMYGDAMELRRRPGPHLSGVRRGPAEALVDNRVAQTHHVALLRPAVIDVVVDTPPERADAIHRQA